MYIEAKIENPISIRIGDVENIILKNGENGDNYPLSPGAMYDGNHYGFVLIIDDNGKQKEVIYPTQCRVQALCMEEEILKVFEEGKKSFWQFSKLGKLQHSIFNEFTDDYIKKLNITSEYCATSSGELLLKNPLRIKIAANPEESVILKDENNKQDYPLTKGAVFADNHFGFIIITDTSDGEKEVCYPTQNKISAIGIEGNPYNDIKIFENGKYNPWLFTHDGKLKEESSYNSYSRKDQSFIESVYGVKMEDAEILYSLKIKR